MLRVFGNPATLVAALHDTTLGTAILIRSIAVQ